MSSNSISFINYFTSYLLIYIIFGACIVGAVFAGIAMRKRKDMKDGKTAEDAPSETKDDTAA